MIIRMLPLLSVFSLSTMVISLIGEAFKTRLIWYIRLPDFLDLVVLAPVYMVVLVKFHEQFLRDGAGKRLRWFFLFSAFAFLYGHAMHLSANAIETFSTEIRGYRDILPNDTYALIYFFDENLSHIIVFVSRYAMISAWLVFEAGYQRRKPGGGRIRPAALLGIVYGLWEAIVFVEGQKAALLPVLALLVGGTWLWLYRRRGTNPGEFLRSGPIAAFTACLVVSVIAGLVIYSMVVGSFREPSELINSLVPVHQSAGLGEAVSGAIRFPAV